MKCVICKTGETRPGTVAVTLERGPCTLVIKSVPADVCEICGEGYVSQATTVALQAQVEEAAASGIVTEVRTFRAA